MTIESILRRKGTDVTTIAPEASIKRAADWLRAKNIGALVVTSGNEVLGLISEREIVHAFSRYGETAGSMPVKEIMQHGFTAVSPDESVSRVMNLMTHLGVRRAKASIFAGCLAGLNREPLSRIGRLRIGYGIDPDKIISPGSNGPSFSRR